MQTFLPLPDLVESANCLDDKRLGNQRREVIAILNAVTGKSKKLKSHPAAMMWTGYSPALRFYYDAVVAEWIRRGFRHNGIRMRIYSYKLPWWLGDDRVHASHRAALLHKNIGWYRQFGWNDAPKVEYYWPVKALANGMVPVGAPSIVQITRDES